MVIDSHFPEMNLNTLVTRLTRALDLQCPIVSAPMAFAAGGALAAAVSQAGGLGLIGAGYGDPDWFDNQFEAAGDASVGVGFITWSLQKSPALGAKLICQCQTMQHVVDALAAGADIIVAQGGEAGGHGQSRATFTLVPEVADYLAAQAPDILLLAAGGIGDGRGVAAALMLGADGVLVGTRLWASNEALVHQRHHEAIVATDGDGTVRTTIADIARELHWPGEFTARIRRNRFTEQWHGHEQTLRQQVATEGPRYREATAAGDPDHAAVWFGEAAGLVHAIEPAAEIVTRMMNEATHALTRRGDVNTL